jgi:hypothetical protein
MHKSDQKCLAMQEPSTHEFRTGFKAAVRRPQSCHSLFMQHSGSQEVCYADKNASTKFAVDSHVEQGKVAMVLSQFKLYTDRPEMFGPSGHFWPIMRPLFQAGR